MEIQGKDIEQFNQSSIAASAFYNNQSNAADLTIVGYPKPDSLFLRIHANEQGYTFEANNSPGEETDPGDGTETDDGTNREQEKEMRIVVQPLITGNKATLSDEDIDNLDQAGTLVIDLTETEDVARIELSESQMETLQDSGAMIEITRDDVTISFKTEIFGKGEITIEMKRLYNIDGEIANFDKEIGSVYDFTFIQDGEEIGEFSEDVQLMFPVDPNINEKEQLHVYYWNEATGEWEDIGGIYESGFIYATTNHFSTYAVFNSEDLAVVIDDKIEKDSKETDDKEEVNIEEDNTENSTINNNELPKTATPFYSILFIGILLLIAGIAGNTLLRLRILKD